MSSFSRTVAGSIAWSVSGSALLRVGQLAIGIVAARLLAPEDFGLFAVTLVVYTIAVNAGEFGVASAVIRTTRDLDEIAPTAVTVAMASGAFLAGAMVLVAPLAAREMGAPDATVPIQVMALVLLFTGPAAVPGALLTRNFQQKRRFFADLAGFIVGNTVLVVLALTGWGVFALAWSRVLGHLSTVLVIMKLAPTLHRPGFDAPVARWLVRFGLPLVAANLVGPAVAAVDVAMIGRLLGPVPLGSYQLAMNVAAWPLTLFLPVLVNVGLPLVSRYREAPGRLDPVLRTLTSATALGLFPVAALITGLAPVLVLCLYGQKWSAAAPVLAVLGVYAAVRVVLALVGDVLVALDATRSLLVVQVVWVLALIPAVSVGVRVAGTTGAATAVALVSLLVTLPLSCVLSGRAGGIGLGAVLRGVLVPVLAAVCTGLVARAVSSELDGWLGLFAGTAAGALVYVALVGLWGRRLLGGLRGLLDGHPSDAPAEAGAAGPVPDDVFVDPEPRWSV